MNTNLIRLGLAALTMTVALFSHADDLAPSNTDAKWLYPYRAELEGDTQKMPFYPHRANNNQQGVMADEAFDSHQVCQGCHTEIYKQWQASVMARSWDDPIYRGLLKLASEKSKGKVNNFCTGCHSPLGLATGKINSVVNRQTPEEEGPNPLPGVNCEACHTMTHRTGLDNGAYVLSPQKGEDGRSVKFGPRKDAVSPFHNTEYSEFHTKSDFCGTCHNVTHPFTSTPIERTYDEWLESPYSGNEETCQDCHMKPFKGKAAITGKEREDVASHFFTGANTTVLNYFGETEAVERAQELLRTAGEIKILDLHEPVVAGGFAKVKVKVMNKGTGHKLPTGFPEGREIWIDFAVHDADGNEIYRLGKVKDGFVEPGTKNFRVHLGDKDGNELLYEVWKVTQILSDNRILPKGYDKAEFHFPVPSDVKGPLKITAKLNYWPFAQALVDKLVGEGKVDVLISEIDNDEMSVPVSDLKVAQK